MNKWMILVLEKLGDDRLITRVEFEVEIGSKIIYVIHYIDELLCKKKARIYIDKETEKVGKIVWKR